jgi:hypothetical protein
LLESEVKAEFYRVLLSSSTMSITGTDTRQKFLYNKQVREGTPHHILWVNMESLEDLRRDR